MEIHDITMEPRKTAGSRAAARLRRKGKLPAILYGHGETPMPVALDRHEVEIQLSHGAHLINLNMEGKMQACLIKDVQFNHLGSEPIHVDLARVDLSELVKVFVPIELRGSAKGTHEGGVLMHEMADVEIECRVSDIPEKLRVDVSHLELDQVMYVKDLPLPEGMTAVTDPESVVALVRIPAAKAATLTEGVEGAAPTTAEPEVISRGKGEEAEKEEA